MMLMQIVGTTPCLGNICLIGLIQLLFFGRYMFNKKRLTFSEIRILT